MEFDSADAEARGCWIEMSRRRFVVGEKASEKKEKRWRETGASIYVGRAAHKRPPESLGGALNRVGRGRRPNWQHQSALQTLSLAAL